MNYVSETPDPPVVGKVTHLSIELIWDHALFDEKSSFSSNPKQSKDIRYVVQEEELGGLVTKGFGTVYSGYARKNIFTGLEPRTRYRYRIRLKRGSDESPWSRAVEVTTTRKPASVDDLQRAVLKNDAEAVKQLLGELNNNVLDAPDKFGYSALMNAAFKGFVPIVELLIDDNVDVNYQNSSGKNALMMACYAGHLKVVKVLRLHGCKYCLHDKSGSTPLHWVVDGGSIELIRWLVNDGCQVDEKDRASGWTPLMRLASTSGDVQTARVLINNGANVNVLDNSEKSILMIAALNGHTALVKLLLSKGAKIELKSAHNKTALDFARSFDHRQIIQVLEEETEQIRRLPEADRSTILV